MDNRCIHKDWLEAYKKMPRVITNNATGNTGKRDYGYAKLETCLSQIVPILLESSFTMSQDFNRQDELYGLTTTFQHVSGKEKVFWFAPPQSLLSTNQKGIQCAGSLYSYLKRYHLLSIFAMATEDDDGQSTLAQPPIQSNIPPHYDQQFYGNAPF